MFLALFLSTLIIGSISIVLIIFMDERTQPKKIINNSQTRTDWGYPNEHCLVWALYKNGTEMMKDIGRCKV